MEAGRPLGGLAVATEDLPCLQSGAGSAHGMNMVTSGLTQRMGRGEASVSLRDWRWVCRNLWPEEWAGCSG